ncbi:MAG: dienelactone hydrolase family protein [Bacteriovoracaceae bacterium]
MYQEIKIKNNNLVLKGHISFSKNSKAWVIFAHGSGSSRMSPRNNWVAKNLNHHGYATLLFDLLTTEEDEFFENRFDIELLSRRLLMATDWLIQSEYYHSLPIAYFGASTGSAAAIVAGSKISSRVPLFTIISRGGRPDLAKEEILRKIKIPVLLIVGSLDDEVIRLNELAQNELTNSKISLVPGATHLFEEPGKLEEVVNLSHIWLDQHLPIEREQTWQ